MVNASKPANAGVHIPPPFWYAAAFALGLGLNRWRPLPMTAADSTVRLALAATGVAVYIALFLGAFTAFRRARTTLIPNRPAAALVTTGPYRLTRNPMYVSLVALYLGVAAFANTWWPVFLLPFVVVLIDRAVIAREERYLAVAFPAEYEAYRARVRRWL
jgi:protein-S-isoprenylcysteine O-methyltransferase Ste14